MRALSCAAEEERGGALGWVPVESGPKVRLLSNSGGLRRRLSVRAGPHGAGMAGYGGCHIPPPPQALPKPRISSSS